jgi:TrmH family RNA methyltransferase
MRQIASRDNPLFKQLCKLAASARERRKTGKLLLEGARLIGAYRDSEGEPELIVTAESATEREATRHFLQTFTRAKMVDLADSLFAKVSQVESPSGVLALARMPAPRKVECLSCALFEDIQDPGNLGSMLRCCAAAGVLRVFLSRQCADAWSPKVLRAAAGAHFALGLHEHADLLEIAEKFQGQVIATSAVARKSVFELDLKQPTAFMFGNEGAGISPELLAAATEQARIPMRAGMESLNAAAAAAVCLFEKLRQEER